EIEVELVAGFWAKAADKPAGHDEVLVKLKLTAELKPPNGVIASGMLLMLCPIETVWAGGVPSAKSEPKLAVTVMDAVILTFWGVAVPESAPPNPVKDRPLV